MDVGSQAMEKIQALKLFFLMNRIELRSDALFLVCFLFLTACSSRQVMEAESKRFDDINEEFSQVVTIAEEAPQPTTSQEKKKTPKKILYKKNNSKTLDLKTSKNDYTKDETQTREPRIEDNKGFLGRRPTVDPFREGERATYSLTYFNTEAGTLNLEILPFRYVNDKKAYHYSLGLRSSARFSMFFNIDLLTETYVDFENLVPLTYSSQTKESSKQKEVKIFWDINKNLATQWEKVVKKNGSEKKKKIEWEIEPFSQNILSSLFYLRVFQLTPVKTYSFRVADSGKNYVFKAEVLRKEKLDTAIGKLDTILIRPSFELEGKLKPTGENLLWVTDDQYKRIVRIDLKIKVGSLVAKVKSFD